MFTGIGGELWLFDMKLLTNVESYNIFNNSTIYGISLNSDMSNICIFGGKEIAILTVEISPNIQHR